MNAPMSPPNDNGIKSTGSTTLTARYELLTASFPWDDLTPTAHPHDVHLYRRRAAILLTAAPDDDRETRSIEADRDLFERVMSRMHTRGELISAEEVLRSIRNK